MTRDELDKAVPGIQLAMCEVIWPFDGLKRVLFDCQEGGGLNVFTEWESEPSADAQRDCEYLVREIAEAAFGSDCAIRFKSGDQIPAPSFREVVSEAIFREFAERFAPHRLTDSR